MYTTAQLNILIDSVGLLISSIIFMLLLTGTDRSSRLNVLFMRPVACNIVVISFDLISWLFAGSIWEYALPVIQVSVFCCYAFTYLLAPLMIRYIIALVSKNKREEDIITRIMFGLSVLGFIILVISQFNGMYYTFDGDNNYVPGGYFWLNQAVGIVMLIITVAVIIRHRKNMNLSYTLYLLGYTLSPILAIAYQTFISEDVELFFLATTISVVLSYGGIHTQQTKLLKEKELELAESKIAMMLSQIQPHFLYNSLSAIQNLCTEDPQGAGQALSEFSAYLRGNLESLSIMEPIEFEQELKHVETYLALEKKRFEHKLRINYDIKSRSFVMPTLTLQPIVENAVRHGITKRPDGGTVTISSYEAAGAYVITVEDDGEGFDIHKPGQEDEEGNDGRMHIGIENVRSRLAAMCGGSLEIESSPGSGTRATIRIPK